MWQKVKAEEEKVAEKTYFFPPIRITTGELTET